MNDCRHTDRSLQPTGLTANGVPVKRCDSCLHLVTVEFLDFGGKPIRTTTMWHHDDPTLVEEEHCQFVVGEQRGEPVKCGAIRAIHGTELGMVFTHEFVSKE